MRVHRAGASLSLGSCNDGSNAGLWYVRGNDNLDNDNDNDYVGARLPGAG